MREKKTLCEFIKEEYSYLSNQLLVNCFRLFDLCGTRTFQHNKYSFDVRNGYLTSYKIEEFDGEVKKADVWDDRLFKVTKRRKIQHC